ncbi:hypothetical protein JCM5353_004463 [Sporobolomyces roseus]
MNRFRRRSESKKRSKSSREGGSNDGESTSRRGSTSTVNTTKSTQDKDGENGNGYGMSRSISTSSLQLPQTDEDFRTSLILPHLTARFELLRRDDGQLVDYETLQTHLDAQRKTGRLTTFEVDQVLLQYKLESAAEGSTSLPPPLPSSSYSSSLSNNKKKRIDWTGIDLEALSSSASNSNSSPPPPPMLSISRSPSLSSSLHQQPTFLQSSPTITSSSSATSFVSFPHSSSSSSSLASTSTIPFNPSSTSANASYTPRRAQEGNGLFGARIGGASSSSGMVKSRSEQSIAATSLRSFRSIREDDAVTRPVVGRGKQKAVDDEVEVEREEEGEGEKTFMGEERLESQDSEDAGIEEREVLEKDDETSSLRDLDQRSLLEGENQKELTDHEELKRISSTALDTVSLEEEEGSRKRASTGTDGTSPLDEEEPSRPSRSLSLLSVPNPHFALPSSSTAPHSPISPVTQSDLTGIDTFNKPPLRFSPEPELDETTSSDTEEPRVDPFPSSCSNSTPIDATQVPLPPSSSISSSLHSLSPEEPTPTPLELLPGSPSPNHRERELTSSTTNTEITITSTISPTQSGPEAFSFPFVPHRSSKYSETAEEEDVDEDEEGDRTLATASGMALPLSSDEEIGGYTTRDSLVSLMSGSGGSSFHELGRKGLEEDDGEFDLAPSSTTSTRSKSERQEEEDVWRRSLPREIKNQEDLLALENGLTGNASDGGRGNRVGMMEDLRMIQDALVRRAEERRRVEMMEGEGGERRVVEQDFGEVVRNEDVSIEEKGKEEEGSIESIASKDEGDIVEAEEVESDQDLEEEEEDSSSVEGGGEGMGSRKDSVESGITSTGAFDFGEDIELAGLGFTHPRTSISTNRKSTRSTKRASRKSVDTGGGGARSTRMELNTSQTSSSPGGFTNSAITPSTSQSDAFEFSSLAGSRELLAFHFIAREKCCSWECYVEPTADVASWNGGEREELRTDSVEEEDYSPDIGVTRSPGMQDLSIDHDDDDQEEELDLPQEEEREDDQSETEDQVSDLPPPSNDQVLPGEPSAALGAPLPIDTTSDSFLRVPRNMPRRDPSSTTSMLIRDVRNQATLATFALKKTPTSPPTRQLSKKSIRKGSISSPHLVSAPTDMATVPIVPSSSPPNIPVSPQSPHSKVSRNKSRKDKDAGEGEGAKKGLGLRFKMLLKKQSRDHLSLNGDEITPFVDFGAAESTTSRPPLPSTDGPPPITPPNQDTARFASPSSNSDFPQTPDQDDADPTTPLAVKPKLNSTRSPPRRPPPPGLAAVEELQERPSPPLSVSSEPSATSPSPYMPSPVPSTSSGKEGRGLTRLVSRLRGSPNLSSSSARRGGGGGGSEFTSPTTTMVSSIDEAFGGGRGTQSTKSGSLSRTASKGEETFGLGIENDGSSSTRESLPYDMRRGRLSNGSEAFPPVANTAPLSVGGRNSQTSLAMQAAFTFPPDSASGHQRISRTSGNVTRTSGHPVRASTDSMQRLWEAAEDLGLPPDKVQELVDSAYAQSPTTSSNERSGSTSSRGQSISTESHRRQRSTASHSQSLSRSKGGGGGSLSSHKRGTSEASLSLGHGRKGSSSSSRSLQDRPPTPPPASRHLRKASIASSREAGPIPDLPHSYSSSSNANTLPPSSSTNSRLSVSNPQYPPPASPSLGSIMSSRRSGYADSFLDFYAQASDDYDDGPEFIPPVPPRGLGQQHSFERSLQSNTGDEYADRTLQQQPEDLSAEHDDGEVVWQVLSDLRNNRMSVLSKDSSFGFDSRDSSFEVEHDGANENPSSSRDRSESIANLLRHRDRKRSSVNMPPFQAGGRFPSIYVRDERKLMELGEHGGVAQEQEGHFFVRPKNDQDDATVPALPQNFRENILSASASSSNPLPPHSRPQPESTSYR